MTQAVAGSGASAASGEPTHPASPDESAPAGSHASEPTTTAQAGSAIEPWFPPRPPKPDPDPTCAERALGSWRLTYSDGLCGYVEGDDLSILDTADGGVSVSFAPCSTSEGPCVPNEPLPNGQHCCDSVASFNPVTCTVHARRVRKGTLGMEPQCETRELTLSFAGAEPAGNLEFSRCWCGSPTMPMPTNRDVTAIRVDEL